MNRNLVGLGILLLIASLSAMPLYAVEIPVPSIPEIPDSDRTLLPDNYPVYVNGLSVLNHPEAEYTEKFLPTDNTYQKNPGCYVACYSLNSAGSAYAVSNKTFVVGQIRVAGSYEDRTCVPEKYKKKDFVELCANTFKPCKNGRCWGGRDTGGWWEE